MSVRALRPLLPILLTLASLLASSRLLSASGHWTAIGPDGGTVSALALQPDDPDVLYAGSMAEVFKSVDRGAHWKPVGEPFGFVADLAIDPSSPSTVYAATGGIVRKSTDGGETWSATGHLAGNPTTLAVTDRGTVYAGTDGGAGIFVSLDGGATWLARNDGLPSYSSLMVLAIDPARPETLYAGLQSGGVYKTEDGGARWSKLGSALEREMVTDLEIAPSDGRILSASTTNGVFRSRDGGMTWTPPQGSLEVWSLAVHHTLPDLIWAGTRFGVLLSRDGGATWETTVSPVDFVRDLVADPERPAVIWAATTGVSGQGGVFRSTDAGAHWSFRSHGLTASQVPALAVTPRSPDTLYASEGYVVMRSRDRGRTWKLLPLRVGYIRDVKADPLDSSTVYALGDSGLFQSTDRGATWTALWSFHNHAVGSLRIDPVNPNVLYANVQGLYRSTDQGRHWTRLKLPVPALGVDPIEIAPSAPQTLYALAWTQPDPGSLLQPHLLRSRNRGKSWVEIGPGAQVQAFAVDPQNARTLWAFTDEGIFRTTDGGDRWTLVNNAVRYGQPSSPPSLVAVPGTPPVLYLAYARTVLQSLDRGATWTAMNDGPPGLYEMGALTPDPRTPGRLYLSLVFHGLVVFEPSRLSGWGPPPVREGTGEPVRD